LICSVAARGSGLDGATVGFVLSYALQVAARRRAFFVFSLRFQAASLFQWTVRVSNEVMNKMVSVSRLTEFTSRVPIEPDVVDTDLPAVARPGSMEMVSLDSVASVANVADTRLHRSSSRGDASQVLDEMWPRTGSIAFKSFSMCYREGLPEVLKDVHLSIPHGARIGVVGRTGSGKSTLIMALYRMGFVTGGSIFIDGVDIGRIPLVRLRSALSIVPQEAQLFIGTVRSNLDPSGSLADAELMQALTRVQMADAVVSMGGLDAAISENGSNMSAGQRQLFCVARAILKRPKILLIDEATASVDSATDEKLQIIIRREFADCTTLTIAHRLHTIADSDKLVVLDAGSVAQFGTVHECSKGGIYRSLLKDT
jgi:ABC-type multidrug transport system fused ATPase/permease subunit